MAEALNVPPVGERTVRYHEHAHALHHLGISKTNLVPADAAALLRRNDGCYRSASTEAKEQLAQLATLVVIRTRRQNAGNPEAQRALDHMLHTFFVLMRRQSRFYQLPLATQSADLPRLQDKLRLLLDMSDASMFPSADQIRRIID